MLSRESEDEMCQDLCLNFWYDLKKLLWQDELNPRVRCAFGNVSLKPLQIYTGIPKHTPPIKIFITSVHYNPDQIYGDVPTHGPHRPYLPKFGEYSFLPPQVYWLSGASTLLCFSLRFWANWLIINFQNLIISSFPSDGFTALNMVGEFKSFCYCHY